MNSYIVRWVPHSNHGDYCGGGAWNGDWTDVAVFVLAVVVGLILSLIVIYHD